MHLVLLCSVYLFLLVGCAGAIRSADDLKNQGYQKSNLVYAAVTGERREPDRYEVWSKEFRENGRVVRFCIVPQVPHAGYQWAINVYVDDREVWTHDAGYETSARAGLRTGVDCVSSPPLPDGHMSWRVFFRLWS